MKREVKYRIWDREKQGMVYFNFLKTDDVNKFAAGDWDVDELMEYIGIKDIHSKEIYEGDKVDFGYYDNELKDFRQSGFVFYEPKWLAFGLKSKTLYIPFYERGLKELVVIGNVFQTPQEP